MNARLDWSPVDLRLAQVLEARGLATPERLDFIFGQARARGIERGRSILAGACVGSGLLSPEAADDLLRLIGPHAGGGETRVDSSQTSEIRSAPTVAATVEERPARTVDTIVSSDEAGAGFTARTVASPADEPEKEEPLDPKVAAALSHVFAGSRYTLLEPVPGRNDQRFALDRRLDRAVVLAVGPAQPPDAWSMFVREALVLTRLDHPSVPKVHDSGIESGRPYFTLDRLEGEVLTRALEARGRPSLPALLRAFLSVAAGVAHAHERGLAHGSIGPEVIVLGSRGRVWLTGWSQAGALEGAPEASARAASGPPPPMPSAARAPEVRRGGRPDERSDVWGLGLVLHWMVKGAAPGARGVASARGVPRELIAIATMALSPDPRDRYPRVSDLQEDVRRFLDGRSVLADRDNLPRAVSRLGRRHPALGVALAAGALLASAMFVVSLEEILASRDRASDSRERARIANAEAREQAGVAANNRSAAESTARIAVALEALDQALDNAATERVLRSSGGERDEKRVTDSLDEAGLKGQKVLALAREALDASHDKGERDERRTLVDSLEHTVRLVVGWARADYFLTRARPDPEKALAEYEAIAKLERLTPREKARAQIGRFLSARRLESERDRARDAMVKLAALAADNEPLAQLGTLYPDVAAAEEYLSQHRIVRRNMGAPASDADKDRVGRARAVCADLPDQALAHEFLGVIQDATESNAVGWEEAGTQGLIATLIDPGDPSPALLRARSWVRDNSLHAIWRWSEGWELTNLIKTLPGERAGRDLVPPREPFLYLEELLDVLGRRPAAARIAELELATLAHAPPADRKGSGPWVRAQLARARFGLAAGLDPGEEIESLEVDESLEGERDIVLGWRRLRAHATAASGLDLIQRALGRRPTRSTLIALLDLLRDPLVDEGAALELANGLASAPTDRATHALIVVRQARLLSRLGRPIGGELRKVVTDLPNLPRGAPADWLLGIGALYFLEPQLAALAYAREASHVRGKPGAQAHVRALELWAAINMEFDSTEDGALDAKSIVVERLRALGKADAARAFAELDPVDEVFVRRDWTPPEAHASRKESN